MSDTYGNSLDFYNVHSTNTNKRGLYLERGPEAARVETMRRAQEPMLEPHEVCTKRSPYSERENFTVPTPPAPQKISLDINADNLIYYIFILIIAYLFYKVIVLELKLASISERIQQLKQIA